MAAPANLTIPNHTGRYTMSHKLSTPTDPLLTLQGLSWLTRKAISLATVVLTIRCYPDATTPSVLHIDVTSVASGLSTTEEKRTLDWTERVHSDRIFGQVTGRSRLFHSSKEGGFQSYVSEWDEQDKLFLAGKIMTDKTTESSFLEDSSVKDGDAHVHSWVKNIDQTASGGWFAELVWGFEEVGGEKRYTRRIVCQDKKGKKEWVRLVYDYMGPIKGQEDDGLAY